jgi:hypothetical protein
MGLEHKNDISIPENIYIFCPACAPPLRIRSVFPLTRLYKAIYSIVSSVSLPRFTPAIRRPQRIVTVLSKVLLEPNVYSMTLH